jgi:hypothetical protein
MTNHSLIGGDSEARVWGLGGRERLLRSLRAQKARVVDDPGAVPPGDTLLLLRGDCIYDARLLMRLLADRSDLILSEESGAGVLAVRGEAARIGTAAGSIERAAQALAGVAPTRPSALGSGYEKSLRKFDVPRVHRIVAAQVPQLETELFDGAYKGVTDLVTKWLWPWPAIRVTRWCVTLGLQPNHVTLAGLALAILAGLAFWAGLFGAGLLAAWIMTFLDTVDGKLARVTVTASRFGDILDHGIDLLHPPLWYAAWGLGIATSMLNAETRDLLIWIIVAGYIGGRIFEGSFHLFCGPFSMFIWRPFDSWNRLITARRNPNLILLTGFWLGGRPDLGLYSVAVWHTASTLLLGWRLFAALAERRAGKVLAPWFTEIDPVRDRGRLDVRTFTRLPSGDPVGNHPA